MVDPLGLHQVLYFDLKIPILSEKAEQRSIVKSERCEILPARLEGPGTTWIF